MTAGPTPSRDPSQRTADTSAHPPHPSEQEWSMTETQAKSGAAGAATEPAHASGPTTEKPGPLGTPTAARDDKPTDSSSTLVRRPSGGAASSTGPTASTDERSRPESSRPESAGSGAGAGAARSFPPAPNPGVS